MFSILTILIVLSLHVISDATKITFSKINEKIYLETDMHHYAMFGQIKDNEEIRIIAVNGPTQYYQASKTCESGRTKLIRNHNNIRQVYLSVYNKCPKITKIPTECFTWSEDFPSDRKLEYSSFKLDDNTVAYSSKSFPSKLAKVIISGDLVAFIHYDGYVALKTKNCLYRNERILLDGINKTNEKRFVLFSLKGDEIIKRHLSAKAFNEIKFNLEQEYYKTYTLEELQVLDGSV